MMESSEEKKKIFYTIVLVLTLITMIIGATLAYFLLVDSQKEEGTKLYTGKLEINYIDGVYVHAPTLIPMSTPTYDTYDNVYRNSFSVASSGTLEQTISIELELEFNEFRANSLKYIMFNNKGQKISTGSVPKTGKITLASDMYLSAKGLATYTLIIWLDNVTFSQNEDMGKKVSGKLNIHSKQIRY